LTPVVLFLVGFVFSLIPIAAFFGKIVRRNGKVVVYLPLFVYDLSVYGFWWLNIAITTFAGSIRRKGSAGSVSGGSVTAALRAKTRAVLSEEDVLKLFDTLPGATTEDMIANWRGRVVHTGSFLDIVDDALGSWDRFGVYWGKRYRSRQVGDPLVLNFWDKVFLPAPIWGNVGVPVTDFRSLAGSISTPHPQKPPQRRHGLRPPALA